MKIPDGEHGKRRAAFLEAWQSDSLSAEKRRDVLANLEADGAFRDEVAAQVGMFGALRAVQAAEPRWLALEDELEGERYGIAHSAAGAEDGTTLVAAVTHAIETLPPPGRSRVKRFPAYLLRVAAVVAILISLAVLAGRLVRDTGDVGVVAPQTLAYVINVESPDAAVPAPFRIGDRLGSRLVGLDRGCLTLQTVRGVTLTLRAPFAARLADVNTIELRAGGIRVRVPRGAEGYRVLSPSFEVIDLGTEFAAEIGPDGTGRVRVFGGKTDVRLIDTFQLPLLTRRLHENQAVLVEPLEQQITPVDDDPSSYAEFSLSSRSRLSLVRGYASRVLELRPACFWRFEELGNGKISNHAKRNVPLKVFGPLALQTEADGNHSVSFGDTDVFQSLSAARLPVSVFQGDFTVAFWMQMEWVQNFALVSAHSFNDRVRGMSLLVDTLSGAADLEGGGTVLHACTRRPPAWRGGDAISGPEPLLPGKWYHVAVVRDGSTLRLFVDGKRVGTVSVKRGPLAFDRFLIGRTDANPEKSPSEARAFVGALDEFAIFKRALYKKQIQALASGGRNVPGATLARKDRGTE